MATARIDTKELERMAKEISDAATVTDTHIYRALRTFAMRIDRKAKEKIQKGGRSGVKYKRGGRRAQRSAAGEPAKTDTGRLAASIRPTFRTRYAAEVGSLNEISKCGNFLETGTSRMAARPWLKPTLEENESDFPEFIGTAIITGGLAG